jgi:hypothetical protein
MKCKRIHKSLTAFLDGELSEPKRRSVAVHLAGCEACGRAMEDIRKTLCWAETWQDREVSPGFLIRLRARIRREEAPSPRPALWLPRARRILAGAAACMVFLGGYLVGMRKPAQPSAPRAVATQQVDAERLILGLQKIKMVFAGKLSDAAYHELNEVQLALASADTRTGQRMRDAVNEFHLAENLLREKRYADARGVLDTFDQEYPGHALGPYVQMAKMSISQEKGSGGDVLRALYAGLIQETVGNPKEFYGQLAEYPAQMAELRQYGWQKIVETADRMNPLNTLDYLERRLAGSGGTL